MNQLEKMLYDLIRVAVKQEWHLKYAKFSIKGHQTLLSHSLVVADIGLKISEILGFSESDKMLVLLSCFLHDSLKATDRWQNAVKKGKRKPEEFWQRKPDELEKIVGIFVNELGISAEQKKKAIDVIMVTEGVESIYHEQAISRVVPKEEIPYVVQLADVLAGLKSPDEIVDLSSEVKMILKRYNLELTYHSVDILRGISTQLLHKGVSHAFEKVGYIPLVFFPIGTIYVGKSEKIKKLTPELIKNEVFDAINLFFKENSENLGRVAFGAINQTILKIPEYLFVNEFTIKDFWDFVQSKYYNEKKPDIKKYILNMFIILNGVLSNISDDPEYSKFEDKIHATFKEKLQIPRDLFTQARKLSNTMKGTEKDKIYNRLKKETALGKLSRDKLSNTLHTVLIDVTKIVHELGKRKYPIENITATLADRIIEDLEYPPLFENRITVTERTYESYSAGKYRGTPICVICGHPAEEKAIASLVGDGAETFYNLLGGGLPLGGENKAWICKLCLSEFNLRKLFGTEFKEFIYILPQVSLGDTVFKKWGEIINKAIKGWQLKKGLMGNYYTWIKKLLSGKEIFPMGQWQELAEVIIAEHTPKDAKKVLKVIEEIISSEPIYKEELESQIPGYTIEKIFELYKKGTLSEILTSDIGKDFLAELEKELLDKKLVSKKEYPFLEAPNYILIGLVSRLQGRDESESCSKLRKMFISGFLGMVLQGTVIFADSVHVIRENQLVTHGYIKVPTDINLKTVFEQYKIGYIQISGRRIFGWVGFEDVIRVLKIIGAAIFVERKLRGLKQAFGRSTLYDVLTRPPGMLLNRIIQKTEPKFVKKTGSDILAYLNILDENRTFLVKKTGGRSL